MCTVNNFMWLLAMARHWQFSMLSMFLVLPMVGQAFLSSYLQAIFTNCLLFFLLIFLPELLHVFSCLTGWCFSFFYDIFVVRVIYRDVLNYDHDGMWYQPPKLCFPLLSVPFFLRLALYTAGGYVFASLAAQLRVCI